MNEHIPTTAEVRKQWGYNYPDYDNSDEAFDLWLTNLLREQKDQAWREGFYMGFIDGKASVSGDMYTGPTPSPYSEFIRGNGRIDKLLEDSGIASAVAELKQKASD